MKTDFYPKNPREGALVYVGDGTFFEDVNLINEITYYYTAFSYDKTGNYSSGAIVSAIPEVVPVIPPVEPRLVIVRFDVYRLFICITRQFNIFIKSKRYSQIV